MPPDVDRLARAHDKIVDALDAKHVERLQKILDDLEGRIVSVAANAPVRAGKLIDAAFAVKQRPVIEAAIRATFLNWAHESVDEFGIAAESVINMMNGLGVIDGFGPDDAAVINQLKRIGFNGYEDIAAEYLDVLANGLYQSTIAGRPATDTMREMAQAVNGVYIKGDTDEAASLVDFVKANQNDPAMASEVSEAVDKLHTIYGRDRIGRNLRRYAHQQVHDGLMQFNASFTAKKAQDADLDHFKYYGSLIRDSRPWCVQHAGTVMSIETIREKWATRSWAGKSPGDPLIVRGGYNCRHHFVPYDPEWQDAA